MDTARTELVWDKELGVESYRFEGVVRPFARHFHTHYVFGLVEEGGRVMQCRGKVYHLSPGHVLLINPGDNHGCEQEGASLTYLSLGIPVRVMESWARSSGRNSLPVFSPNTVPDMDMALYLRLLHTAIAQGESVLRRKEVFGYLLDLALARYAYAPSDSVPACSRINTLPIFVSMRPKSCSRRASPQLKWPCKRASAIRAISRGSSRPASAFPLASTRTWQASALGSKTRRKNEYARRRLRTFEGACRGPSHHPFLGYDLYSHQGAA